MTQQITESALAKLREDLRKAEEAYSKQKKQSQQEVVLRLEEIKLQLDRLMNEAQKLAQSVDLVFFYNDSYEEFRWCEEDVWNSSSAHC